MPAMIPKPRREWITVPDVNREVWLRILEFANKEFAYDAICARHGTPDKTQVSNYFKQTSQIRACILQAQEYFEAASNSSLFTSPNHLYYGMASLSSAIMLIRGDGSKALDVLRKDPKVNGNHGLSFTIGIGAKDVVRDFNILENSHVEISRYGHFANWYSTLASRGPVWGHLSRHTSAGTFQTRDIVATAEYPSISELAGRKHDLLTLMQHLPDLAYVLNRYGALKNAFSRVSFRLDISLDSKVTLEWRLHSAVGPGGLDALLEGFTFPMYMQNYVSCKMDPTTPSTAIVKVNVPKGVVYNVNSPTSRMNSLQEHIMYADSSPDRSHLDMYEIAESYMLGYALSMLSRYFPDLWIGCLESHGKAGKLIERIVGELLTRFPLMALSEMGSGPIIITSQSMNGAD